MIHRYSMQVRGLVGGAGLPPFVSRLVSCFGLGGLIKAQIQDDLTTADLEGRASVLDRILDRLATGIAASDEIDEVCLRPEAKKSSHPVESRFRGDADLAICVDCLVELFDRMDGRSQDPFITCACCGPRWSLTALSSRDVPSAAASDCPRCRAEFDDATSRRFHSEAISCPDCGPRLRVEGLDYFGLNPIEATVAAILTGKIGALKGSSGYHLACDATSSSSVRELRRRKRTDARPMPVMVANLTAARVLCEINDEEAALLTSPRRPIVILKKKFGPSVLAPEVTFGSPTIGVVLPYTAMHYLILHELRGLPIVMTGGHSSGEPIAFEDLTARKWLRTVADFFLVHDRPILIRSDDSVTRFVAGGETILRRSRGYVPESIALPRECPVPILAVGSQSQSTFTLGQGSRAISSHHLSDLSNLEGFRAFGKALDHFETRLEITPELIAHDFDSDDLATFHAVRRGAETLPVQHSHAHVASCMAENGLDETVIGVVLDGDALGGDGSLWGGEFLVANYDGFRRAGQFRTVPLPEGKASVLQPWKMAVSYLDDAHEDATLLGDRVKLFERRRVEAVLKKRVNAPGSSSVARLLDTVAVLAGLDRDASYEGQGADELELAASELEPDFAYPFRLSTAEDRPRLIIDTRPIISAIASDVRQGVSIGRIGRRFHSTLVEAIAAVCDRIRSREGLNVVALSGSVFQNKLLLEETIARLGRDGFSLHHHRQVPTHDGGISLGQLAIAAAWASQSKPLAIASESPAMV